MAAAIFVLMCAAFLLLVIFIEETISCVLVAFPDEKCALTGENY